MLDVHILTLPGLPAQWVEQRRTSIMTAVERAEFPVAVHEVHGISGHLGKSRELGYSKGEYPYVTHVDHDDWLREDAFAVLRPYMDRGDKAITTGEFDVYGDTQIPVPDARHHLAVFRRDALAAGYAGYRHYPDQYLLSRVEATHISECVYMHRIYRDSASRKCRRQDNAAAKAEFASIGRGELFIAESMTPQDIEMAICRELADG